MTDDFCYSCGNHGCGLCDPKNHPIAWLYRGSDKELPSVALDHKLDDEQKKNCIPLTPQRTWVGLTDEEIDLLEELYAPPVHPDFVNDADHCTELMRHVEAKLKEKNT